MLRNPTVILFLDLQEHFPLSNATLYSILSLTISHLVVPSRFLESNNLLTTIYFFLLEIVEHEKERFSFVPAKTVNDL